VLFEANNYFGVAGILK